MDVMKNAAPNEKHIVEPFLDLIQNPSFQTSSWFTLQELLVDS